MLKCWSLSLKIPTRVSSRVWVLFLAVFQRWLNCLYRFNWLCFYFSVLSYSYVYWVLPRSVCPSTCFLFYLPCFAFIWVMFLTLLNAENWLAWILWYLLSDPVFAPLPAFVLSSLALREYLAACDWKLSFDEWCCIRLVSESSPSQSCNFIKHTAEIWVTN